MGGQGPSLPIPLRSQPLKHNIMGLPAQIGPDGDNQCEIDSKLRACNIGSGDSIEVITTYVASLRSSRGHTDRLLPNNPCYY